MKITFLSIFPESFSSFLSFPVIERAVRNGLVDIEVKDIKDCTDGSFRAIDDSPYGGGAGLLLRVDALCNALSAVADASSRTILMGPKGKMFTQKMAHELAEEEHIILIAGHYEGVDERFRRYVDDEVSIGDYVLTGGESAAIVVAEAVIRLLDGVLRGKSSKEESFEDGILEYPQYTHPSVYDKAEVPEVLLGGNREEISRFCEFEAIRDTIRLRPDLLEEDRNFNFFSLHRDYRNESGIIRWLANRLPVPEILYEDDRYLVLSRPKGRTLASAERERILKTMAAVLKMLWSIDISDCPYDESLGKIVSGQRDRRLSYEAWRLIDESERMQMSEDMVFSHGNLRLDRILVNGNGISCIIDMQHAGIADRYRDIADVVIFIEEVGIDRGELFKLLEITADDAKLSYFMRARKILRHL